MATKYDILYRKNPISITKADSNLQTEMGLKKPNKRKSKRDKVDPENYMATHEIIYGFFRADPLINACVSVTTDNVCSDGFETILLDDSPEAERQKAEWEQFMMLNNWMSQMRNVTSNLGVFDDAFMEIRPEKGGTKPSATNVLDTPQIAVNRDSSGNIIGYSQYIRGKKVADFEVTDIIHFKLNNFGDSPYGLSLIEPVLLTAAAKRYAELYSAKYFQNQKPRGAWIFPETIDDDDYDDAVDMIIEAKNTPQKDLFLRGTGIDFKSFTSSEDMEFVNYLKYLREQIVTSMLVPPIMLGIPEGSNKSNSDVQIKAFDRRIRAIQQAIEYKINMHLIKYGLGFDKIEFRFKRINKAEQLRDMEIIQKYAGFTTINEVREMAGLPELDPEIGDKLWKDSNATSFNFGTDRETTQDKSIKGYFKPFPYDKIKSTSESKPEQAPPQNPIKESDENKLALEIIGWLKDIKKKIKDDLTQDPNFSKAIEDPAQLVQKIIAYLSVHNLRTKVEELIHYAYNKGAESASKEIGFNYSVDNDALDFIKTYTFDLVKGINDDLEAKLKQVLQRAVIEGKGMDEIKKDINTTFDMQINRAETLARTEMQRAGNYGRLNAYQDAGVQKIQWLSMIDNRTSQICRNLNGQIIKTGELFKTNVKGKKIEVKAPPAHPNCRSTIIAVDE